MKAEKVVKVLWKDSMSDNGRWTYPEDMEHGITDCITYGWLVEENETYIAVAQTRGIEPEQYCHTISIPRCSIVDMMQIDPNPELAVNPIVSEAHYVKTENIT